MKKYWKTLGKIALFPLYFRKNHSNIDPSLQIQTWKVSSEIGHNSFTDLCVFLDHFYLVYVHSPMHLGSNTSKVLLLRSTDMKNWDVIQEFQDLHEELRDPKLCVIAGKLVVYMLKNRSAAPVHAYKTVASFSKDGLTWSRNEDVSEENWLYWRPKTNDNHIWYVASHNLQTQVVRLYKTVDGLHWDYVSVIAEGFVSDETAIEFLGNGTLVAVTRREFKESIFGHLAAHTLISTSEPPFEKWKGTEFPITRLDGPNLIRINNIVIAIGRFQPKTSSLLHKLGSVFAKKRTSIFSIAKDSMTYLSDLPSNGDTSYAGAIVFNDTLYISYYTNRIDKEYIWLMGMLADTEVRIAAIPLKNLKEILI